MSYERALNAINLRPTNGIPEMELLENPAFIQEVSKLDPYDDPAKAYAEAYRQLDVDFVFNFPKKAIQFSPDCPVRHDEQGKLRTQWGVGGGADWESDTAFKTVGEVFSYDPFEFTRGDCARILGTDPNKSIEEMAVDFERGWQENQNLMGDAAMVPGFYANTLFHHFVTTYGWELTIYAAVEEPEKFKKLIHRYFELSFKVFSAWAEVGVPALVSHDDIAMKTGTIFSPDWLREHIFPYYPRLWEPLKQRGVKVIFFSDGDLTKVVDDVFDCGADGMIFESLVNLDNMLARYGGKKVLMGNIDTMVLTTKGAERVEAEVRRCLDAARGPQGFVPGYFVSASSALPQNLSLENLRAYFDAIRVQGREAVGSLATETRSTRS